MRAALAAPRASRLLAAALLCSLLGSALLCGLLGSALLGSLFAGLLGSLGGLLGAPASLRNRRLFCNGCRLLAALLASLLDRLSFLRRGQCCLRRLLLTYGHIGPLVPAGARTASAAFETHFFINRYVSSSLSSKSKCRARRDHACRHVTCVRDDELPQALAPRHTVRAIVSHDARRIDCSAATCVQSLRASHTRNVSYLQRTRG